MSVFKTYSLESLAEFPNRSEKLAIFERDPVKGADEFFQKIMIKYVHWQTMTSCTSTN